MRPCLYVCVRAYMCIHGVRATGLQDWGCLKPEANLCHGIQGGWEFIFFSTHLAHCLISPSPGTHCFVLVTDLCWDLNTAASSLVKTPRDPVPGVLQPSAGDYYATGTSVWAKKSWPGQPKIRDFCHSAPRNPKPEAILSSHLATLLSLGRKREGEKGGGRKE